MNSTIRMSHRLALAALSLAIATTLVLGLISVGSSAGAANPMAPAQIAIAALFAAALTAMYFEGKRLNMPTVCFASICAGAIGILAFGARFLADNGSALAEAWQTSLTVAFSASILWLVIARVSGERAGTGRPSGGIVPPPETHRR